MRLRNPYLFAPIKTGWSDGSGRVTDRHLAFYRARAKHVGAVIPEPFYLDRRARELPSQMGIDSDELLPGLERLVGEIHAGGAAAIAHLNHAGRMANPRLPGNLFLSSTGRACEAGGATPVPMSEPELAMVTEQFVSAATRARRAGFDALELQMGHGYLLAQFLSPLVNDRDDEYGGDLEGRARFPLRVLDAIRAAVELPVFVRVSGSEMVEGGITLDQAVALAGLLATRDVEALHVTTGTVCTTPPWFFQHMFVPAGRTWDLAEQLGERSGLDVVVVGRIDRPSIAQTLERRFPCAYIAVGRALVADPDFVGKVLGLLDDPVRPCLACAEGCLGGVKAGVGLRCAQRQLHLGVTTTTSRHPRARLA